MFALLGFVLIYLDTKLPEYARGSRLWVLVMVVGSSLFLLMALFMEQALLTHGLPLIERLALVVILIFAFSKTRIFKRFLVGKTNLTDRAWLVLIFGVISVYGTYRGIGVDGIIINFRDLGPMVAGLIQVFTWWMDRAFMCSCNSCCRYNLRIVRAVLERKDYIFQGLSSGFYCGNYPYLYYFSAVNHSFGGPVHLSCPCGMAPHGGCKCIWNDSFHLYTG